MENKTKECCDNCKNNNYEQCSDLGGFQFHTIFENSDKEEKKKLFIATPTKEENELMDKIENDLFKAFFDLNK